MKKMNALIAASALGIVGLALAAPESHAVSAGAKVCKSWISGSGKAIGIIPSKAAARSNWSAKAVAAHGAAYGQFSNASVGAFVCNKNGLHTLCTVRARPCAPVGLKTTK